MTWPAPPYPFGNATSPENTALLDVMFNQTAAMIAIPCSAAGLNAIALTPLPNCPALNAYSELGGFRFRAAGTSTGPVTASYNSIGFLNVYHADGVTQVTTSDLTSGFEYVVRFSQSLTGGSGGFFLEAPAAPVGAGQQTIATGGRLTLQAGTPVMTSNQLTAQIVYFAPYMGQTIPIYNGSQIQQVQFTSGPTDQVGLQLNMGGGANFPINTNFDCFVSTLGLGFANLVAIPWTNNTTRATTLSIFGGFLTNTGAATVQTGNGTSTTMQANQGTFIGSYRTSAQGQSQWRFGSGTQSAFFGIGNYYNTREVVGQVQDTSNSYTYTSTTIRQAHALVQMQVSFIQPSLETTILASYQCATNLVASASAFALIGFGLDSTTAFLTPATFSSTAGNATTVDIIPVANIALNALGWHVLSANEGGDGVNANTFGQNSPSAFVNTIQSRILL